MSPARVVRTGTGARLPVLGLGTWRMGERRAARPAEAAALRLGVERGLRLIDTAEMYADGGAEEVVAEAIEGRRDQVFLVSKVLPGNASRRGTIRAAERSLRRLRTDRIDLYLLHWPGDHPLEDTLSAFAELRREGKILHYGLSNFDLRSCEEASRLPGGEAVAANQVLYNLRRRGVELDLLPWCRRREVALMAYSPLEQGGLIGRRVAGHDARRRALEAVAGRHGRSAAQVALAWVLSRPGVVAIPKASDPAHVRANAESLEIELTDEDHAELDAAFPAPSEPGPLETL